MHLQVEADAETATSVLVENSVLYDTSGVYRLHDLTHEFLHLVNEMELGNLRLAASRQAKSLANPETLHA